MNQNDLPPRFRESAFRRYEPYIRHAVEVLPSPFQINPTDLGLAATTVQARLKDAIHSLYHYRWAPTSVNMAKFDKHYHAIEVGRDRHEPHLLEVRLKTTKTLGRRTNIAFVDIPLDKSEHRKKVIEAALVLANAASDTLGTCGLGGLRLKGLTKDELPPEASFIETKEGIILV